MGEDWHKEEEHMKAEEERRVEKECHKANQERLWKEEAERKA
jgi:hypothetical protein